MINFHYKALSSTKVVSEGTIGAKSRQEAATLLSDRGLTPLSIKEQGGDRAVRGSIPTIDKITFCRYMGIMLSTGLSISEGIEVLRVETKNVLLKQILGDLEYGLEQGHQLSTIFSQYPGVFEPYFITLIKAGEVSGKLAEVFQQIELQLRAEYSLRTKVMGALLYPAVIFVAMIGIGVLMFFFVLPQIGKVFLSLNLPLPGPTKFMFTLALALSTRIPIVIGGAILGAIVLFLALRTKIVRELVIAGAGVVPIISSLIKKIDIARFCRIFSTLIRSAVPITEALELSFSLLTSKQYRLNSLTIPDEIRKGRTLAAVMKEKRVFPSLLIQMIAAGEKTATLDATMADVASFYEEEVEEEVKGLTQIIEPVMMLCVGIAVGIMILSIISPIYSVVSSLQSAAGTPK